MTYNVFSGTLNPTHFTSLPCAQPTPQPKAKGHLDRISCICTAHGRQSLSFIMGRLFPQNCHFPWGSGPHLIYGSLRPKCIPILWPTPASPHNPYGISIGSAVFAGPTTVSDGQNNRTTHYATRSVTIGRIYVYVVVRCGLTMHTALKMITVECYNR